MPPRLRPKAANAKEDEPAPAESSAAVERRPAAAAGRRTMAQQAFASTAHLANLLPTGTLLAFQVLTPVFSANGRCDGVTRHLTELLLGVLALTAFLACFTDSLRTASGLVVYGFATRRGMWLFDARGMEEAGETPPAPAELRKYRLSWVDFVHAVMSVLVFGSVAMRDKNVVGCLYPDPDRDVRQVLNVVPLAVGFFCAMMFVVFPTRRHGVGYPVTD